MKGMVFTELLEMLEDQYGMDFVEDVILECDLPSGGAYTAVGTYNHKELLTLVSAFSQKTEIPIPALVKAYGEYLWTRFTELYPQFFENVSSAIDFLPNVESYIHVEVKKLYPDAELPSFEVEVTSEDSLQLIYRSPRPFQDLAEGLIEACLNHFEDEWDLQKTVIEDEEDPRVQFRVTTCQLQSN